jgi:hypothetical protein
MAEKTNSMLVHFMGRIDVLKHELEHKNSQLDREIKQWFKLRNYDLIAVYKSQIKDYETQIETLSFAIDFIETACDVV